VNQLVQGKITGYEHRTYRLSLTEQFPSSVDVKKNQIEMSFKKKPGKAAAKQKSTAGLADFAVGQKVDTIVRKVSISVLSVEHALDSSAVRWSHMASFYELMGPI
jgi:hypothetical protein